MVGPISLDSNLEKQLWKNLSLIYTNSDPSKLAEWLWSLPSRFQEQTSVKERHFSCKQKMKFSLWFNFESPKLEDHFRFREVVERALGSSRAPVHCQTTSFSIFSQFQWMSLLILGRRQVDFTVFTRLTNLLKRYIQIRVYKHIITTYITISIYSDLFRQQSETVGL